MSEVILTQADNGRSIEVQRGDLVVIHLRENPSTGFQWAIDHNNDEALKLERSEYTPPAASTVGGAGQRTFTFSGRDSGAAEPHFKLWREWQGEQSVVERFSVTVQVHE